MPHLVAADRVGLDDGEVCESNPIWRQPSPRSCTASKLIAWFLTWVFMTRLGGLVVLTHHAAEYLPPPDWEVQRGGGRGFLVGRSLLAGLVGPVPVVMVGVLAEDRSQVPFVVDEQPVSEVISEK